MKDNPWLGILNNLLKQNVLGFVIMDTSSFDNHVTVKEFKNNEELKTILVQYKGRKIKVFKNINVRVESSLVFDD